MTQEQLEEKGIYIEEYGGGFIVADYRDNLCFYYGKETCRRQPLISDPMDTLEEALIKAEWVFNEENH